MTRAEALAEARRRWGDCAWARHQIPVPGGVHRERFMVGSLLVDPITKTEPFVAYTEGRGKSWAAAFADADRRERERAR